MSASDPIRRDALAIGVATGIYGILVVVLSAAATAALLRLVS